MAKKQKLLSDIELMEARRIAVEQAEKKEKIKNMAKPALLTRYFVAFIDFLITFIASVLLITFLASPFLKLTNYHSYNEQAVEYLLQTNLYDSSYSDKVIELDYDLNDYDLIITNYYSTNEYAISKNKIEEYNKSKIQSGLYIEENNSIVKIDNYDKDLLKEFLTDEYSKAISFAKTNETYITLSNKSFVIVVMGVAIVIIITTTLFYLIIPICRKEGETIGKIIFKICIIDTNNLNVVSKKQVFLRFFFYVFFNYYLVGVLFVVGASYVMFLPLLISALVVGIDKNNRGIHDFLSNTMVICKHRTNAMKMLQDITHKEEIDQMGRL